MPKGQSGRIVVELDPNLKRRLYSALAMENSTLKQWFVDAAQQYVAEREKPLLPRIKNNNQDKAKRP